MAKMAKAQSSFPAPEDIKLIVTDIDGTLLTSEHTIHPTTLAAFHKLRTAHPDLPIVIASGKQRNSCLWIRDALRLPPHFPAAHCNGAVVYGAGGGPPRPHGLLPEAVQHVVDGTQRFGTFIFTEDAAMLVTQGEGVHRKDWCEIAGRYDTGIRDCTQEPVRAEVMRQVASGALIVPKVTICVDESELDAAALAINALPRSAPTGAPFAITRAIPFIFEAVVHDVHKGTALEEICEGLGEILPSQVLVFGDGENDVCMFERAGHAVAMGNAMPKALAAARYTTGSNDEGGVGQFIEQVWKL